MLPLVAAVATLLASTVDLARVLVTEPPALEFTFQNRHETERFALLDASGAVRPDALKQLSHFVRCWRTDREKALHPRLVEIVARVADHFQVEHVEVISGYRAAPYGAPHSKHFLGHAMDLQVPGVPAKQVASWVWQTFRHVGVGYYPKQEFVHVDVREEDVRWIDQARHGESAHARYFGRPADEAQPPEAAPTLQWDEESRTLYLAGISNPPLGGRL